MDYLHSCYTAPARLIAGSDETFTVRWYRAAPGAKVYPFPHAFASSVWDDSVTLGRREGVGEFKHGHVWSPNRVYPFDGQCDVPNPDWLLHGLPQSVYDSGPPATLCCHTLAACDHGVIAFNGQGVRATAMPSAGAFAVSGSATTARVIVTGCESGVIPMTLHAAITSAGVCTFLAGITATLTYGTDVPFGNRWISPTFNVPTFGAGFFVLRCLGITWRLDIWRDDFTLGWSGQPPTSDTYPPLALTFNLVGGLSSPCSSITSVASITV